MVSKFDIKNDFNFNPEIWGPKGWFFLDTIIMSYPDNPTNKQKKTYTEFIYSIGEILPCSKCRNNYNKHLESLPLTVDALNNKRTLIEWWLKIHNLARVSMDKRSISYEEFIDYYNTEYSVNEVVKDDLMKNLLYFGILVGLIIMLMKYKK